jgi:CheY-like chemotaxis protein
MTTAASCSSDLSGPPTVLVVDDTLVDQRLAAAVLQQTTGWKTLCAGNGLEALAVLERDRPALVLTDLLMPGMDGLELVEAIRQRYPLVPIVLMTAHGNEEMALQALKRGAASYVPKRSLVTDLAETLEQVWAAAQTHRRHQRLLDCLTEVETRFVLENDRSLIPPLVNYFQEQMTRLQLCDQTGRVRVGVALEEALLNALYHGNLEVGSALRQESEEAYQRLAEERREQLPYRERRILLTASLSRSRAVFVIRDEGPGFDPGNLPDPTDPANLERTSGRGLLLIQTFMDEVSYNPTGNEMTMVKHRENQRGKTGVARS